MNAKPTHRPLLTITLLMAATVAPACETEGYDDLLEVHAELEQIADAELELTADATPVVGETETEGRRGRVAFGPFGDAASDDDTRCKVVSLANPFPADAGPLRVQASIDHRGFTHGRDATTVWVRWANEDSLRLCVRETSESPDEGVHYDGLGVSYWIYRQDAVDDDDHASGRDSGRSLVGDARDCSWVEFGQDFSPDVPVVHATIFGANAADNDNGSNLLDRAPTVWIEKVETDRAKICARSTSVDAGDQATMDFAIDWYAYRPGYAPGDESQSGSWTPSAELPEGVDDWTDGSQCKELSFAASFDAVPDVFVTADHLAYSGHDAVTTWIEDLDEDGMRVCFEELADPGTPGQNAEPMHRADIRLRWTAIE